MNHYAAVTALAYHLPDTVLTNEDLARQYPDWSVDKIFQKTGISRRHIAAPDETAVDLAAEAGRKLLAQGVARADEIDLLLFCTQSPDYALPSSACIIQDRLRLPKHCAAFDYNLGCSGFVYGLAIAKSMLESGLARKCLLVTSDTYSKYIDPGDHSVRTIFGDGAAGTLVELVKTDDGEPRIGPFVFGTDGSGFRRLIVHGSGLRAIRDEDRAFVPEGRRMDRLFMDGPEIFSFTIRTVPASFRALLDKAGVGMDDIDWVVFHQANAYMLEHLRRSLQIPSEKFVVDMAEYGNTVSSTIPIALTNLLTAGKLKPGGKIIVVGFGVGYSWAAAAMSWIGR